MSVLVSVTSPDHDQDQMNAVASVIFADLMADGFTDVRLALEYPEGNEKMIAEGGDDYAFNPQTVLEELKLSHAELFQKPVVITVPVLEMQGRTWEVMADSRNPAPEDMEPDEYPSDYLPENRRWLNLEPNGDWARGIEPPPPPPEPTAQERAQAEKDSLIAYGQSVLAKVRNKTSR
jgi:hypothetical protein